MTAQELRIVSLDAVDRLNEASAKEYRRIGTTLDESDARAMIEGIMENHAGVVFDIVAKKYIHNLATLQAMDSFMRSRI